MSLIDWRRVVDLGRMVGIHHVLQQQKIARTQMEVEVCRLGGGKSEIKAKARVLDEAIGKSSQSIKP